MHDTERPPVLHRGGRGFGRRIDAVATRLEAMPRGHDGHSGKGDRMREGRRILVVEDNFLVATLLAEVLESVGWQVVGPVAHLAGALDAAASEGFDAAVLDVNLGGQAVYPV